MRIIIIILLFRTEPTDGLTKFLQRSNNNHFTMNTLKWIISSTSSQNCSGVVKTSMLNRTADSAKHVLPLCRYISQPEASSLKNRRLRICVYFISVSVCLSLFVYMRMCVCVSKKKKSKKKTQRPRSTYQSNHPWIFWKISFVDICRS